MLSQGYQTPGESGLAKWRFSNVYPVMKLKLDKSSDGPSIDDMVDASKEFVNIEAERTEQRIRKTFHQFMNLNIPFYNLSYNDLQSIMIFHHRL